MADVIERVVGYIYESDPFGDRFSTNDLSQLQAFGNERDRCVAIIQAARFGEIDRDWRSIIHMIESGLTLEEYQAADTAGMRGET